MRLLLRLVAVATLSGASAFAYLWNQAPPVLAGYCPRCFGFTQSGPHLWVDSPTRAQLLDLPRMTTFAMADVDRVFGPGASATTVLMCTTMPCAERMKAPQALGAAYGRVAVLMTPFGIDAIVLRHELSHVARSRVTGRFTRRVFWREEGLAEWVAKGPRLARDCPPPRALPARHRAWAQAAQTDPSALYAQAHCLISREIEQRGVAAVALER